jgi:hypothetical protein
LLPPAGILIAGAALVAGLAGCGGTYSRQSAIDTFSTANPEATPEQAGCVVDSLIDRYSLDRLEVELDADPPDAAFEEVQFREMARCGLAGDLHQLVLDQLVASGISEADAPCVADRLVGTMTDDDIDVLVSGQISEQFSAKFLQAIDDCDALSP